MSRKTVAWCLASLLALSSAEAWAAGWMKIEARMPEMREMRELHQPGAHPLGGGLPNVVAPKRLVPERFVPLVPLDKAQRLQNKFLLKTARNLNGDAMNIDSRRRGTSIVVATPDAVYRTTLKHGLLSTKSARIEAIRAALRGYPESRTAGTPLLIRGSVGERISTKALAPQRLSGIYVGELAQMSRHSRTLNAALDQKLSPATTRFVNIVPSRRADLDRLDLAGTEREWKEEKAKFDGEAERSQVMRHDETKEGFLSALKSENDVVVVVAHGDFSGIYMPDGSKLEVADIERLPRPAAAKRPPVVVMIACETGMNLTAKSVAAGATTISRALIDAGWASIVIAPTGVVPLKDSHQLLKRVLDQSSLREIFRQMPGEFQMHVELALPDRADSAGEDDDVA